MENLEITDVRLWLFLLICGLFCFLGIKLQGQIVQSGRKWIGFVVVACALPLMAVAQVTISVPIYAILASVVGANAAVLFALWLDRRLDDR